MQLIAPFQAAQPTTEARFRAEAKINSVPALLASRMAFPINC